MKKITDISALDPSKRYTYADYLTWQFSERVELIKGWLYKMSPAPKRIHQKISAHLIARIDQIFKDKPCDYYAAPFDVRLKKQQDDPKAMDTVVQPDISIICDRNKLDDSGCNGAPDLIMEILSETTAKKDYNEKFNLYEENGVKEYWIVNPATLTLEIYFLTDNSIYQLYGLFDKKNNDDKVTGQLFPDLEISLKEVFKD